MHGESKRLPRQHMWPPVGGIDKDKDKSTTENDLQSPIDSSPQFDSPSADFFFKDGRKIGVGDCALFQAGDAPPFIGLIRWIKTQPEQQFAKLCVSWLYRPSDVKLSKGVQLNSAPNEVFYSFHKDVISSASVLHPCRVAFLRKGVESSATPSFVCRRVYDIEHKCLWWLTDKDYINERQEEVDALLDRTRQEMHAGVQSGGRSPKPLNGPSSSQQQLKSGGSDSSQNIGTGTPSFPSSHPKGKKRERSDQVAETANKRELRERSNNPNPKSEDAVDSTSFKADIAKMSDKGGLVDTESVDKLVSMIQLDRTERKLDFSARVMLADVIAGTNRDDCLDRFVQLRGVPVLDEWLQEAHKQGKNIPDSASPREGDTNNSTHNNIKSVEDLLLALLRALDKLPVNLNALRTCNIGKSVNHLKNHKNLEIQKKARFLVDTWKKRVDAEMKINDGKIAAGSGQAVTWQGKPSFLEVSRRTGSSEPIIRGPGAHLAGTKSLPAKAVGNSVGSTKPQSPLSGAPVYKQSGAPGAGNSSSEPPAGIGEEKSTSSSQSQSCSSEHAKTVSTAGSMYKNRQRRLVNGPGAGPQKESNNNKSGTLERTGTLEKTSDKHGDIMPVNVPETGNNSNNNNTRLIVRLPNLGRSPARGTGAGAVSNEDPAPVVTDKQESTVINNNNEDRKNNEVKEGTAIAAPDETDRSSAVSEDKGVQKTSCSSPQNEKGTLVVAVKNSFSSMNALIESCVKYSEVSTPPQAGDDVGMNLLATVAAGEILKSEVESPAEEHREADNDNKGKVKVDEVVVVAPKSETSPEENNNKTDSSSLHENKVKIETNEKKTLFNKDSDSVKKPDGSVKQECDNKHNAISEIHKDDKSKCAAGEKIGEGNLAAFGDRSGQDKKEPPCEEAKNNNPVVNSDKAPETTKLEFPKDNEVKNDPSCITPLVNESETKIRTNELNSHVSSTAIKPETDATTGARDEPGAPTKLDFDLNEGIELEDTNPCEPATSAPAGPPVLHNNIPTLSPFLPSSSFRTIHSPITVVAAPAKVPFEPPETLLQRPNKGETGWKGSAATSAFRPAEPRKVLEMQLGCASSDNKSSKHSRPLLEFDLNVADERAIEEEVSQSSAQTTGSSARGFDLDLNRVDADSAENNNNNNNGLFLSQNYLSGSGSGHSRIEVPLMPLRPPSRNNNIRHHEAANGLRDFDLNNGPALDEASFEPIARGQIVRNNGANPNMPFLHPVAGLRLNNNNTEVANNMSSWYPPGNSYPAVAIPSFMPERAGELPPQPYSLLTAPPGAAAAAQRMLGQVAPPGGPHHPFSGAPPVLSSSPAGMAFSPAAFPYAGFHFSPTFPLGSNYADSSSGMPFSQLVGPGGQGAVSSSSHFPPPRPYLINLPESSNSSGGGDNRRWVRQGGGSGGLDLNSGPGGGAEEEKGGGGPVIMRQILGGGMTPQAFAEEQARMFQMGGGKRKEPDGGWDSDASRSAHKLSWH